MPVISFCVPVMNRLDDLKATLAHNLEVLDQFGDKVEIIVACFDKDDTCEHWVLSCFSDAVRVGRLRFYRCKPLRYWHFAWAKNAFSRYVSGRYYSSLDGDNFLSSVEVATCLQLLEDDRLEYVIHHWSGEWGDGTSGRITLPSWAYKEIGYINDLYPRQFDEIGLLIRTLERYPWLIFVSRPGVDLLKQSQHARSFFQLNELAVTRLEIDFGSVRKPERPRGSNYVTTNKELHFFQEVNAHLTLYRYSRKREAKERFQQGLKERVAKAFQGITTNTLNVTFESRSFDELSKSSDLSLYAVIHNDFHLLKEWVAHYRSLGVKRFILVDDGSSPSLEHYLTSEPDVFVFRPLVGEFKLFKVIWLRMLMKAFQHYGSWVITADSDEFLDIPTRLCRTGVAPLDAVVRALEERGRYYAPGILVDLLPDDLMRDCVDTFRDEMRLHLWRTTPESLDYGNLPPIRWAFGSYWRASLRIDVRYRLFGTVDCLRKIPLFRHDADIELNQGYHTLSRNHKQPIAEEVWQDPDLVLPIRHYKMASIWSNANHVLERRKRKSSYFDRTESNLNKIYQSSRAEVARIWQLSPFKKVYCKDTPFLELDRRKSRFSIGTNGSHETHRYG